MINPENLKFGDKVYVVKEHNNAFKAKKIRMIDSEGVEWSRYDIPRWDFTIEEITYCGKVSHIEEGEVRFDEDRLTEYHFKNPDGQIYYEYEDNPYVFEKWFVDREEAVSYGENLKKNKLTE